MKKRYIFLILFAVLFIGFTVTSIFFFRNYYKITKEIYKVELNYSFTSLSSVLSGDDTVLKQRPNTSAMQAEADASLDWGITFSVFAVLALMSAITYLVKILDSNRMPLTEETNE